MKQIAKRTNPHSELAEINIRLDARINKDELSKTVRLILARYPQRSTGDDDYYVRQMVVLLAEYPAVIVQNFEHPKTDPMPASAFLPSVPEVREVCDKLFKSMCNDKQNIIRRLPPPPEPEIDNGTEAERAAQVKRLLGGRFGASLKCP